MLHVKQAVLLQEAEQFVRQLQIERQMSNEQVNKRLIEIKNELKQTGSYTQTEEEVTYGAKLAWRNSNRCIGRLFWNSLTVFDARSLKTEEEVFEAIKKHLAYATNNGKIRSTITIFAPGKDSLRLHNQQLIRYAGYLQDDGTIIGDPISVELTTYCQELGWQGKGTPFDVLPLVIGRPNQLPTFFEIPEHLIKEVPIQHPQYPLLNEAKIKWYGVPFVSNMKLEIGGLVYPFAPFNGWYMGTEIGARNLADEDRYNLLPLMAKAMGITTKNNRELWKDRALVELNYAVLASYEQANVTLVDHHTAAKQFQNFEKNEKQAGRKITGNWTWLIPPLSPAATHIYHRPYDNTVITPNYFYQPSLPFILNQSCGDS